MSIITAVVTNGSSCVQSKVPSPPIKHGAFNVESKSKTIEEENDEYFEELQELRRNRSILAGKMRQLRQHCSSYDKANDYYSCCKTYDLETKFWGCRYNDVLDKHEWDTMHKDYVTMTKLMSELELKRIRCSQCDATGHTRKNCKATQCISCGSYTYNHDKKSCSISENKCNV